MRAVLTAVALVAVITSPLGAQDVSRSRAVAEEERFLLGRDAPEGSAEWFAQSFDPRGMTLTERQMIQDALIWTAGYGGLKDGAWGNLSAQALTRWRTANGLSADPMMSRADLQRLFEQAIRARDAVGWTITRDERTGSWFGYPALLGSLRPYEGGTEFVGPVRTEGLGFLLLNVANGTAEGVRRDLNAIATGADVARVLYRLDRPDRQVVGFDTINSKSAYLRYDLTTSGWKGIMLFIPRDHPRAATLITAISAEFGPAGPIIAAPRDGPVLGAVLSRAMASARGTPPMAQAPAPAPVVPTAPVVARPAPPNVPERPSGSGTAFVVRRDGTMLTNEHVVRGCSRMALPDGTPMRVSATDRRRDLAIVVAQRSYENVMRFRRDQTIDHGERVRAFGYPFYEMVSTSLNITEGIVTALNGLRDNPAHFQLNAAIQPGNSGGPVLDEAGLVIGVAVSTLSTGVFTEVTGVNAQSMNYAIRGAVAESFLLENGVQIEKVRGEGQPDLRETARLIAPSVTPILCYGRRAEGQ